MTTVSNEIVGGTRGDYYGAKVTTTIAQSVHLLVHQIEVQLLVHQIEVPSAHLGLCNSGSPWTSALQWKHQVLKYRHALLLIVLARDSGSGTVSLDKQQQPQIDYVLSGGDGDNMVS